MSTETLEARLVREPLDDVVHELLDGFRAGIADGKALPPAALLAVHVDVERGHQNTMSTA